MLTELKFTFNDNEEDRFYKITNADNLYSVIQDFDDELANFTPQKANEMQVDIDTIDTVRSILHGFMSKHNIKI